MIKRATASRRDRRFDSYSLHKPLSRIVEKCPPRTFFADIRRIALGDAKVSPGLVSFPGVQRKFTRLSPASKFVFRGWLVSTEWRQVCVNCETGSNGGTGVPFCPGSNGRRARSVGLRRKNLRRLPQCGRRLHFDRGKSAGLKREGGARAPFASRDLLHPTTENGGVLEPDLKFG